MSPASNPGASLAEVVDALNMLGVSPSDLVAILEALKTGRRAQGRNGGHLMSRRSSRPDRP